MIYKGFITIPIEIKAKNLEEAMKQGNRIFPHRGGLFDNNGLRRRTAYHISVKLYTQRYKVNN